MPLAQIYRFNTMLAKGEIVFTILVKTKEAFKRYMLNKLANAIVRFNSFMSKEADSKLV
jgi:hypothetical protein